MAAPILKGSFPFGVLRRMQKDPLGVLREAARLGDVVAIDLGPRKGYLVNHPDLIKRVLQDNRANYPKSVLYEKMRNVFGDGLLLSEGGFWATQRKLIQPAFIHSRLDGMSDLMVEETLRRLPELSEAARAGRALDVSAFVSGLTLSIVVKAMFGTELTDDLKGIADAVELLNGHANHRFHTLVDLPLWIPTPRNRRARAALEHLEAIVYRIIRERKREGAAASTPGEAGAASPKSEGNTKVTRKDLLGMLLDARYDDGTAMPEKQVRDEVMTIFMAGHETTATAIAWTLSLLAENPEALARMRAELEEVLGDRRPAFADLPRLPYLKAVFEESMRLRPPVWSYSRTAAGPDNLGGVDIPKGALVFLCNYAMHRDPRFWEAPEAFRPERFSSEEAKKRPGYAYFPFGGGPRICIGNGMSMVEGQLVLACLLRAFGFRHAEGRAPEMNPLVTLRPKGGLWMVPEAVPAAVRA